MDTETSGLDWRVDSLGLCQLFTPQTGSILVRISGAAPTLRAMLEDVSLVKVFHFAPFDLRFLEAKLGARTTSVFCTKAASKLLDPGAPASAHSLGALLREHFDIQLDKGGVRTSDWMAADLSAAQIEYAAGDVTHLLRLADLESRALAERGLEQDFRAHAKHGG